MSAVFDSKLVAETVQLEFSFLGRLAIGETLSESGVACVVFSGTDPAPEDMILGDSVITETSVLQRITGGVAGVIYNLSCEVTTSDLNILIEDGKLAVTAVNPFQP